MTSFERSKFELHPSKKQITTEDGNWITKTQDSFARCIEHAKYQPKVLLYPKSLVDSMGIDETIEWILKTFDIKMHLIYSDDHQYLFEEVQHAE